MVRKIFMIFILIIVIALCAIYLYRHALIQYYAEKIIHENLPSYVKIDKVRFDFGINKISFVNFKVLNPPGFSSDYFIKIKEISCKYGLRGGKIKNGIEISDVLFNGADIELERLKDGRINAVEMGSFVKNGSAKESTPSPAQGSANNALSEIRTKLQRNVKLSDYFKMPGSFVIKDARIAFMDRLPYDKPHLITIDYVNGDVTITLDENYSKILALTFILEGNVDESKKQTIRWAASLNPTTPRITMSNRFNVSNMDLLAFEPYYDRFAPFIFYKGRFSGTLIFDFDNGSIGSSNEIKLSNLEFAVKPGLENSQMWETNVQDLMQYFTTTSGDIVFDFKLKGDMSKPVFYLGPISKRALTSMAIDKMASYAVKQVSKQGDNASDTVDKAKGYIDLFKNLVNKK
jgi:hypothetical protein